MAAASGLSHLNSFREANHQWELSRIDPTIKAKTSTATFLIHVLHEAFVGNVPVDILEKFPGNWAFYTFLLTYAVFIGCYIGFFTWAYIDGESQTFISLNQNAGNCHPATKPLSGTFLASSSGHWEGTSEFLFSEAAYQFAFHELSTDYSSFQDLIANDFSVSDIGAIANRSDIASNLLVWMHYRKVVVSDNNVQIMKLYSSPSDVFDRKRIQAGSYLNTASGPIFCNAKYASFDATTATATASFANSSACWESLHALRGMVDEDGDLSRLKMLMTSFTTAAAVNANLLSMDLLERLAVLDQIELAGQTLYVNSMVDPAFPRSNTLVCSDLNDSFPLKDQQQQLYFIDESQTMLLPVLAHIDEHCASCGDDSTLATVPCDYFGFLPFYIYFPDLVGNYTAQSAAYFDFFMRVNSTEIRKAASRLVQHGDAEAFNALCPHCGVFWVYLADDRKTVSPYKRPLPGGLHCTDSISSSHCSALGQRPPVTLNEKYYVCRATLPNNIMNAVGLAFGNTSVFAGTFLALVLPLLFYLTKKIDRRRSLVRKYGTRSVGGTTSEATSRRNNGVDPDIDDNGHSRPRQQHQRAPVRTLSRYLSGIPTIFGAEYESGKSSRSGNILPLPFGSWRVEKGPTPEHSEHSFTTAAEAGVAAVAEAEEVEEWFEDAEQIKAELAVPGKYEEAKTTLRGAEQTQLPKLVSADSGCVFDWEAGLLGESKDSHDPRTYI